MKKFFAIALAASLLLMGTQAKAQLSVGAGYQLSLEKTTSGNNEPTTQNYNGFYAGASYNLHIVAGLGVAPGLYMNMLFGRGEDSIGGKTLGYNLDSQYQELALNLPIHINYRFNFGRDNAFILFAGPVFQFGLLSLTKYTGTFNANLGILKINDTERYTYNHYKGDDNFKPDTNPFNIYLGGGAGVQLGDFQIFAGYDYSMLNVSKLENTKASRSQIKAGIALSF